MKQRRTPAASPLPIWAGGIGALALCFLILPLAFMLGRVDWGSLGSTLSTDEATSALDPENEENVVAAVDKLRETATILVIAHKLDTIRKADAIVQLRADGTVEDIGTHEELFARGGTYRSFWDHRAAAQGWQL